jgi:hypothetical protein
MSTIPKTAAPGDIAPSQKSWLLRHKILTLLGILVLVVLVSGTIFAWPLIKLRFHPQYATALAEIRGSKAVAERLGEPINPVRPFPGGTAFDDGVKGEARLIFSVQGPKDTADVSAVSTMMQGKWGFTQLKLTFSNKQEINLAADIQNRDGNELPRFDPNAKPIDVKPPDLPVDINLPPLPETPAK